ncbi:hypothetical protein Spla01_06588 [Streptomyces platensis]|uniref:Uncharacterized protein n=1 Tax=Streptomyces platensis TaxID=58346 RepID=A0ABX3Y1U8_STRPT|nr:hypothetical protein BG653_01478 [Streptomyces platensis]
MPQHMESVLRRRLPLPRLRPLWARRDDAGLGQCGFPAVGVPRAHGHGVAESRSETQGQLLSRSVCPGLLPRKLHLYRRERLDVALPFLGHRGGHVDGTCLGSLRKGEVQLPVNRLDLTTDVQHAPRIVDVLGTQSEHFTLTKSASQAEYDSHPVSRTDHVSDLERPLQQPRLSTLPRRLGPLHGLRMHRVPGEALVINGSIQDAGQLGQDAAPVIDRGDGGLQLRYVCAKFRRRNAPERQRQLVQMRHDVKSRPPLLVLLGFRNSSPARGPAHRDVVGQCDGSVAERGAALSGLRVVLERESACSCSRIQASRAFLRYMTRPRGPMRKLGGPCRRCRHT